jgi:hypothetical protein
VHDRPDLDRLADRIDPAVDHRELAHHRQALLDHLCAEMGEIEQHVVAVGALQAATGLDLLDDRARDHVARAELGLGADAVVARDEKALALRVLEVPALSARRLGDENAGARQSRRVVLDELHVLERDALAIGERHAIAGLDVAVGGEGKDLARAAGGEDHRAAQDRAHGAGADIERGDAAHRPAVDDQLRHEVLVVAHDPVEAQRVLEQRVQHVEADLVGGVPGALGAHAAERARGNGAVLVAAPRAAPVLEPDQLLGRLLHEVLDHVLVAEEVRALHGVEAVHLEVVVFARNGRRAAFCRDGVAAHRVDLRDHRHRSGGRSLDRGDRSADARAAAAYDHDVVTEDLDHSAALRKRGDTVDNRAGSCCDRQWIAPSPSTSVRHATPITSRPGSTSRSTASARASDAAPNVGTSATPFAR